MSYALCRPVSQSSYTSMLDFDGHCIAFHENKCMDLKIDFSMEYRLLNSKVKNQNGFW